jgi:phage terminase small subunit
MKVDGRGRRQTVRKVKFWDKVKGLELLGKHLKLFTEKVEHSGSLTLEQLVLASMKKPEGE